MPAGLTIYNDAGTVQIDENWKNYGFIQKIPVTITSYTSSPPNPAGWNGMPYQLVVSGSPQLLVGCKSATLQGIKQFSYYSAGTWYLNWLFMIPWWMGGPQTETVWFYVFDTMDGTYSNVGFEVFNAAGERVFHSGAPLMRLGGASPGIQPCNVPFIGDVGREYCPLILVPPFWVANISLTQGNRHFSWGNRSIANYITADETAQLGAMASLAVSALPGLYAAIDVTGL